MENASAITGFALLLCPLTVASIYTLIYMDNFKETATTWLRNGQEANEQGQMDIATYGNSLLMAQVTGTDFRLHNDWPPPHWHVFLHVHEGELRLTANNERLGFRNTGVCRLSLQCPMDERNLRRTLPRLLRAGGRAILHGIHPADAQQDKRRHDAVRPVALHPDGRI